MVQPSSVDVRVDRRFRVFHNARYPFIDVRQPMDDLTELVEVRRTSRSSSTRGSSCSGRRWSGCGCPNDLVARLEGKSSLGRLGLLIHSTAGFVDAGFEGNLTLELSNVANLPITIYHGMPIGQISFMRMDGPVENPYGSERDGSKYQGQAEPTPSRFYLNFEQNEPEAATGPDRIAAELIRSARGAVTIPHMPNIGPLEVLVVLIIALSSSAPSACPSSAGPWARGSASSAARSPATTRTRRRRGDRRGGPRAGAGQGPPRPRPRRAETVEGEVVADKRS